MLGEGAAKCDWATPRIPIRIVGSVRFNPERLVVTDAKIDGGPTFKRIRPRARGMAYGILKRTSSHFGGVDHRHRRCKLVRNETVCSSGIQKRKALKRVVDMGQKVNPVGFRTGVVVGLEEPLVRLEAGVC